MTVEELEILISANIEPALKEIKKLIPQIKQTVEQATSVAQKSFNSMNMEKAKNSFEKAVDKMKNKLLGFKNKETEVKIKVNKQEASKQITQLEKEIESLQKKIEARKIKMNEIDAKIVPIQEQIVQDYTPEGGQLSDSFIDKKLSENKEYSALSAEWSKLDSEVASYNKELDEATSKVAALRQQVGATGGAQSKLGAIFSAMKAKIQQAAANTKTLKTGFNSVYKVVGKITGRIKTMGSGMKSGIGSVMRYAGALFSLRTIYTALSGAAQAWLSSQNAQAQQLSANIEYMKYAMGSTFAPVIQYVTDLVFKLMKALQSLVYAFSGVNIFAKATASSMKSASGSASKASKALSGVHGEINNVSENNGGGGSGSVSPSIDLSSVDSMESSFLDAVRNRDWGAMGAIISEKINTFFATTDWFGLGNNIAQGINAAITFAFNFVTTLDWSAMGASLGTTFSTLFNKINWTMIAKTISNALNGLLNSIIAFFFNVNWLEIGMSIGELVAGIDWLGILEKLLVVVCQALMAVIMLLAGFVWEILSGVGEFLYNGLIEPCVIILTYLWEKVKEWFGKIKDTISNIFTNIKTAVVNIWNSIVTTISNVINKVKTTVSNVLEKIKTTWTNIWNGIKTTVSNVWNGIWSVIKSIVNKILGGIESFVNGVIKGINKVLSGISKVANAVGSVIGLNPISLQLSTISLPRLATGNVAYSETLAVFGEYSGAANNPEITAPQNIMRETFSEVLDNHEFGKASGEVIQLSVYVGNKKLGEILLDNLRSIRRQTGQGIEALVGG